MLILGFGNKARNGKDTAAESIRDYFANDYDNGLYAPPVKTGIFKFATALYKEVEDLIGQYGQEAVFSGKFPLDIPGERKVIEIPSWVTPGDPTPAPMAKYGKHPKLLQWWGTEYRRTYFGTNYWVDRLFASIPANLDIAMISDTRFPNEADGVKQRGGFAVNVQRLREDGTQYYSSDRPVDHPSEIALDNYNWDFYLKIPHGHAALTGELAIALAAYLRGLHS